MSTEIKKVTLTGDNTRIVGEVQSRLNKFTKCTKAFNTARKALDELSAKNVELADRPVHEDRYQALLPEYKKAAEELKTAAEKIEEKTDAKHLQRYCQRRDNQFRHIIGKDRVYYYINWQFQDYLAGVHASAEDLIKVDFEAQITQLQNDSKRRKTEALLEIEFSQIDQTFPTCRERLISENPGEYLRQSALYQYKLLEKKDEAAVVAFGDAWIKNIPKEATWEQVANMSFIMLQAAEKNKSVNLIEYRAAVQQWLKEHPLPDNPSAVDSSPDQATSPAGQRTYVLGLLYLHGNSQLDLSPEALQIYQRCSALYPDQHSWKVVQALYHISKHEWEAAEQLLADLPKDDLWVRNAQRDLKVNHALYHISKHQWAEAEKLLADLPIDDPLVGAARKHLKVAHARNHMDHRQWIKAQLLLADLPKDDDSVREAQRDLDYYRRERITSAVMDLGVTLLFKFIPSHYREKAAVDIGLTSLHLGFSGPVRQMWLPRVLGIPKTLSSHHPFWPSVSSGLYMAGDVVDCAVRNSDRLSPYQRIEHFTSYTLRIGHAAWTLKDPLQLAWKLRDPLSFPVPSVMNLGSLLISASQLYDASREIRRSPIRQASLSSFQLIASDVTLGIALTSYSDLLPVMASSVGATSLADRISFDSGSDGEEGSKGKWVLAAIVIGSVAFRCYRDYPYLWAAAVMRDMEFYSSQGDQAGVEKVLADAKNKYLVSRARPIVEEYGSYAKGLKDYPRCLEDSDKSGVFLKQLDQLINRLKVSHHYRGILNNLLLKKIEVAIRKEDKVRVAGAIKEGPNDKIVKLGFQFLLNWTFILALRNPAAACSLIKEMKPEFPARFHPTADSLLELVQEHSESLQEWSQLHVLTVQQIRPDDAQIDRWKNVLAKLQDFFSMGETEVYQDLQYFKLMIAFAQPDKTQETANLFETSNPELHQRFAYALVSYTRGLRKEGLTKEGRYQLAIDLLRRGQIKSFKYNKLIEVYSDSFSLLYSLPLRRDAIPEQMQKLESCIASLDAKDECHQELRVLFQSCRIVLSLEAGESPKAKELLAQETDSRVPDEVAALLFERMLMRMKTEGPEAGHLNAIIENLGSWKHQQLLTAYQAYLVCEPSLEATVESLSAVINLMKPIEQLSEVVVILQQHKHLPEFELRLSQGNFAAAKNILTKEMPEELRSDLCKILFLFFIDRGEHKRRTALREAREELQILNTFLAPRDSTMIQSYIEFLALLDSIDGKKELAAHQSVDGSLKTVLAHFDDIKCDIPQSLKGERVNILLNIALLAREAGQPRIGLEALDSIRQVGIPGEELERYMTFLARQLSA